MLWRPTKSACDVKDKLGCWLNEVKTTILWLIHHKDNNEPIGFIAANEISPRIYGDVGITLGVNYFNKGYGSEALETLINYIKNKG